ATMVQAAEEAICTTDPNVIFCDNFNDRADGKADIGTNKGGKTLGWAIDGDPNSGVVTSAECLEGKCFRHVYPDLSSPQNKDNGGGGFMQTITSQKFRTVYIRFWVKYPSNWVNSINGSKLLYHENSDGSYRHLTEIVGPGYPALNDDGIHVAFQPNM